jgi:hypothetical protein
MLYYFKFIALLCFIFYYNIINNLTTYIQSTDSGAKYVPYLAIPSKKTNCLVIWGDKKIKICDNIINVAK